MLHGSESEGDFVLTINETSRLSTSFQHDRYVRFVKWNCCFDAMSLITLHYFILCWKWHFFCASNTNRKAFSTDSLNKPNLLKSASIDHNSLAFWFLFFDILKGVTSSFLLYFTKVKCFLCRTLRKLVSYSDSISCLLLFCSREVKSCFNNIVMEHTVYLISRKVLMMKCKDRECYMHLKFHINPPYIN